MRPLLIDDQAKAAIAKVKQYAENNVFSMNDMLDTHNKELAPAGDVDEFTVRIYKGYRIVYTVEKQNIGKVKHISISVDAPGMLPSIPSAQTIINEFGFSGNIQAGTCLKVELEDIGPNHQAINIWDLH